MIGRLVVLDEHRRLGQDGFDSLTHARSHPIHTPSEVDRGRSGISDRIDVLLEDVITPALLPALDHGQGHAQGADRPQCRSSTHHEPLNRVDQPLDVVADEVDGLAGQPGLVQQGDHRRRGIPLHRPDFFHFDS
jgi:hypothetical protein